MPCAGLRCGNADAAGIGEQVEQRLAGDFLHHASPTSAHIEKEPRVLPRMAALEAVFDAELKEYTRQDGDLVLLGRQLVGNARVRLAAVVVERRQAGESVRVEAFDFA